jgi:hypothetical protein
MQSGIWRGTYGIKKAHEGSLRGVATDALNLMTITCDENGELLFWPFKEKGALNSTVRAYKQRICLDTRVNRILMNRDRF